MKLISASGVIDLLIAADVGRSTSGSADADAAALPAG